MLLRVACGCLLVLLALQLASATLVRGKDKVKVNSVEEIPKSEWTAARVLQPQLAKPQVADAVRSLLSQWIASEEEHRCTSYGGALVDAFVYLKNRDKLPGASSSPPRSQSVGRDQSQSSSSSNSILAPVQQQQQQQIQYSGVWQLADQARNKVVAACERLNEAHQPIFLQQLKTADLRNFIFVASTQEEFSQAFRSRGFLGSVGVLHFTDTWSNLKAKKGLDLGKVASKAEPNPRQIWLYEPKVSVAAIAHELVHWLSHPAWEIFEGNPKINEGTTEATLRELCPDLANSAYDQLAGELKGFVDVTDGAYLAGDKQALRVMQQMQQRKLI